MCESVYVRYACELVWALLRCFETPNNKAEESVEEKGGSVSCVTITLACELAFCAVELVRQRNLVNAYTFHRMLCIAYTRYCYIVWALGNSVMLHILIPWRVLALARKHTRSFIHSFIHSVVWGCKQIRIGQNEPTIYVCYVSYKSNVELASRSLSECVCVLSSHPRLTSLLWLKNTNERKYSNFDGIASLLLRCCYFFLV